MVKPASRKILGLATCQNPFGESRDADRERVAAIRRTMMSDLNIILGGNAGARTTAARGMGGVIEIRTNTLRRSEADHHAESETAGRHDPAARDPRHTTVAAETIFDTSVSREGTPGERRTTRGRVDSISPDPALDRQRSLSRRAAAAREKTPNF